MNKEKTKVFLNRIHVAYIRSDLLLAYRRCFGVVEFAPWLRKSIYENFGILVQSKEDVDAVNAILDMRYYDSLGEWLQEKMRTELEVLMNNK